MPCLRQCLSTAALGALLGIPVLALAGSSAPSPESLLERDALTGDWGGIRPALETRGITFSLEYTHEYLANVSGGLRRGGEYNALATAGAEVDLEKLASWRGGLLHADVLYTLGSSLSGGYVGDEANVSNINYRNSIRLAEAWLQQAFLEGRLAIRVGQLGWDSNFGGSAIGDDFPAGDLFINSDFGALPIASFNVPLPMFPIYAPGVMLRLEPSRNLYVQAAVYDGNPSPGDFGDPSPGAKIDAGRNDHGTRWRIGRDEGASWAGEIGYLLNPPTKREEIPDVRQLSAHGARVPIPGQTATADGGPSGDRAAGGQDSALPGIYKIGAFFHSDQFTDFRSGRAESGDWGVYAIASQVVWREAAEQGLTIFGSAGGAPDDRSRLDFSGDIGVVYRGLLPGRDDDQVGVGFSFKRYSDDFSAAEVNAGGTRRGHEAELEFTYEYRATGWLSVQPDIQYVINPSGAPKASDAWVIGIRSAIVF